MCVCVWQRQSEMLYVFVGEHVGIFHCAFKEKKKSSNGEATLWHSWVFFTPLSSVFYMKSKVIETTTLSAKSDVTQVILFTPFLQYHMKYTMAASRQFYFHYWGYSCDKLFVLPIKFYKCSAENNVFACSTVQDPNLFWLRWYKHHILLKDFASLDN